MWIVPEQTVVFHVPHVNMYIICMYLSIRRSRSLVGEQNERYVIRKVRTRVGSGGINNSAYLKHDDCTHSMISPAYSW